jgi:hydroxymethylglutaryl-CoA lyase
MTARRIELVEVGPRDGLQNDTVSASTEQKVAFVDALSRTGLRRIEVSAFVSPKWVPQLADAAEVFDRITRVPGVRYSALVPNLAGLERSQACRIDELAVFTAASETFSRKNINASIAESLERLTPVVRRAGKPVRGYVSTCWHCPYEGAIAPEAVVPVVDALLEMGCVEIAISDTIGKATVDEVKRLLEVLLRTIPASRFALHMHDTYGNAVANCLAAAEYGITIFDGAAGGLGGCPYAPGAPGNVATEAMVRAFGQEATGVDADLVAAAGVALRAGQAG